MREDLEEYERCLLQKLAELERDYRRAAQPILADLAKLESMKPPKPIINHAVARRLDTFSAVRAEIKEHSRAMGQPVRPSGHRFTSEQARQLAE